MPEAVIVATVWTSMGRAFKGSLRDERPDDVAAPVVVQASVPEVTVGNIDDLLLGFDSPGGEQGFTCLASWRSWQASANSGFRRTG